MNPLFSSKKISIAFFASLSASHSAAASPAVIGFVAESPVAPSVTVQEPHHNPLLRTGDSSRTTSLTGRKPSPTSGTNWSSVLFRTPGNATRRGHYRASYPSTAPTSAALVGISLKSMARPAGGNAMAAVRWRQHSGRRMLNGGKNWASSPAPSPSFRST